MEVSIQTGGGYIVAALVSDDYAGKGNTGLEHFHPFFRTPFQSDAIELRNYVKRGRMNDNRLKMLIRHYDGTPKRIKRWNDDGSPDFRRVSDDEMKFYGY